MGDTRIMQALAPPVQPVMAPGATPNEEQQRRFAQSGLSPEALAAFQQGAGAGMPGPAGQSTALYQPAAVDRYLPLIGAVGAMLRTPSTHGVAPILGSGLLGYGQGMGAREQMRQQGMLSMLQLQNVAAQRQAMEAYRQATLGLRAAGMENTEAYRALQTELALRKDARAAAKSGEADSPSEKRWDSALSDFYKAYKDDTKKPPPGRADDPTWEPPTFREWATGPRGLDAAGAFAARIPGATSEGFLARVFPSLRQQATARPVNQQQAQGQAEQVYTGFDQRLAAGEQVDPNEVYASLAPLIGDAEAMNALEGLKQKYAQQQTATPAAVVPPTPPQTQYEGMSPTQMTARVEQQRAQVSAQQRANEEERRRIIEAEAARRRTQIGPYGQPN